MANLALVGDIGGTNSRFGLVEPGPTTVRDVEALKNNNFGSLEEAVAHYVEKRGVKDLAAAAIAVAGPTEREVVALTNRDWRFTRDSLRKAAHAAKFRLLNDFEALALSLPHLEGDDIVQIGGETPTKPGVKIVLGPGTGLGMATLAPLPQGGWMALPGEVGHITLPIETLEEFDWRASMSKPGVIFESEDAITGGGLAAHVSGHRRQAGADDARGGAAIGLGRNRRGGGEDPRPVHHLACPHCRRRGDDHAGKGWRLSGGRHRAVDCREAQDRKLPHCIPGKGQARPCHAADPCLCDRRKVSRLQRLRRSDCRDVR